MVASRAGGLARLETRKEADGNHKQQTTQKFKVFTSSDTWHQRWFEVLVDAKEWIDQSTKQEELTAIHKVTGTRIYALMFGRPNEPARLPNQQLAVKAHTRGDKSRVSAHFGEGNESNWPEDVVFDPEIGEQTSVASHGSTWSPKNSCAN